MMHTISKTYIYALIDPITKEVRYIGKSDNPWTRIHKAHFIDNSNTYKVHWIQSLKRKNLVPMFQILEECKKEKWQEREIDWIAFYKNIGCKLTNGTDGGDGLNPSNEVRKKISDTLKEFNKTHIRKKISEKTRRLMSESGKGKKRTQETKRKISESKKGLPSHRKGTRHSEQSKRKNSEAHKGKKASEETKKLLSESHKGRVSPNKCKHFSEEIRKKMSESHKGNIPSNKGKSSHSEEARKKIGNATKLRWRNKEYRDKICNREISKETRIKISKANKGKIPWNKNKTMPFETRFKISNTMKQKVLYGSYNFTNIQQN